MIRKIYEEYLDFYKVIENEYSQLIDNELEWEVFHLRFLLYYLVRYKLDIMHPLFSYHYRACYRLYIEQLLISSDCVEG
ncbi:sigma(X)-activator ComW [Streptococcus sp. KHUD_014]|uniref:sigma(X)-activator ComW n=1 Tax=Streptococcus sp. KHUD_014 TaxID=3434353 RepID=UPI003DA50673